MSASNLSRSCSRRTFFAAGAGGVAGLTLAPNMAFGSSRRTAVYDGFPHQDPALVKEVVTKSHFDLDGVRELVKARPELAKSAWDWGFGDWESALGAASHTGRREIAEVLIAHGARPNLFTFAMQGHLDAVRAIIEANPGIQRIHGPHGITLLNHAKNGGEQAASVKAYLEELGDAGTGYVNKPLSETDMKACHGHYAIDGSDDVTFEILDRRGMLSFKHADISNRPLFHQGDFEFHPSGAEFFRFKFTMKDGQATEVAVSNGASPLIAKRVG